MLIGFDELQHQGCNCLMLTYLACCCYCCCSCCSCNPACTINRLAPKIPQYASFASEDCNEKMVDDDMLKHDTSCTGLCSAGTIPGVKGPPQVTCSFGAVTYSGDCTPSGQSCKHIYDLQDCSHSTASPPGSFVVQQQQCIAFYQCTHSSNAPTALAWHYNELLRQQAANHQLLYRAE
jgi:hypothetical protein